MICTHVYKNSTRNYKAGEQCHNKTSGGSLCYQHKEQSKYVKKVVKPIDKEVQEPINNIHFIQLENTTI